MTQTQITTEKWRVLFDHGFGESIKRLIRALDDLEAAGVSHDALVESLVNGTSGAMGKLMLSVIDAVVEYQRETRALLGLRRK